MCSRFRTRFQNLVGESSLDRGTFERSLAWAREKNGRNTHSFFSPLWGHTSGCSTDPPLWRGTSPQHFPEVTPCLGGHYKRGSRASCLHVWRLRQCHTECTCAILHVWPFVWQGSLPVASLDVYVTASAEPLPGEGEVLFCSSLGWIPQPGLSGRRCFRCQWNAAPLRRFCGTFLSLN